MYSISRTLKVERETFFLRNGTRIVLFGTFIVRETLNVDVKDLLSEYKYRLLKLLESTYRTFDADINILSSKVDGISRDFCTEIYIPA